MSKAQNIHIVLVHGAWHVPEHYTSFLNLLQHAGYTTHCPRLPTCTNASTATFQDDVSTVSDLLLSLTNQGRKILLVLHSYGGAVGTQAAKSFSLSDRSARGLEGGIVHLLYMCAFMLQQGQTVGSASLPRPDPDPVEVHGDGTTFLCVSPKELFYRDVRDEVAEASTRLLVHHSATAVRSGIVSHTAWNEIPTTYLMCTEDEVLFPEWQQRQIDAAKDAGASIEVWRYTSGHSPYMSMPIPMLDAINQIVERYR